MEKLLIEDYAGTSSDDINYQSLFQEFWVVKNSKCKNFSTLNITFIS